MRRKNHPAIWIFDSDCLLCDWGVRYTLRHEKMESITFVAIQSPQGRAIAEEHGIDPNNPLSFLFIETDIGWEQSDAVIALSRHLNGPAKYAVVFRILSKWARDAGYRIIAHNRYRLFGRIDHCTMRTPETAYRFIQ